MKKSKGRLSDQSNNVDLVKDEMIGIINLNNPPENYLSHPEFISLDLLKKFLDSGIKGLIITGSGRHFSVGANHETIINQAYESNTLKQNLIKGNQLLNFIENIEIPVIAAITGVCFGGGLEIALSCHIRISSKKSLFAFPEINRNLMPGLGGISRTERLVGKQNMLKLVLSGDTINAKTAHDIKLVDHTTEHNKVKEFALDFLKSITADRSLKIINAVMRSIHNNRKLSYEDALIEDTEMFCRLAMDEANRKKRS